MLLRVSKTNSEKRVCEARSTNDLLVVFSLPDGVPLAPGDVLSTSRLELDSDVQFAHEPSGRDFLVFIAANNVHDLRLPVEHGGSRTPTHARIAAA